MSGIKMFVILKLFHFPSWDSILRRYKSSISIARYWIFDPGCWIVDPLSSMSESGCWILNPRSDILDTECKIFDSRHWVFSSGSWMFDSKRNTRFWFVN
ncbi:MAG: hypothetical protein JSV34_00020 [Candidatus Omnitrophota bacterium]|nr:MAG: hypothetical protein JSV34_00020 [Candidatus Omnitrophota bacterium]